MAPPQQPEVQWRIPASAHGCRLDRYLAHLAQQPEAPACLAKLSRSHLQQWVAAAHVQLDGRPCRAAARLGGGQLMAVRPPQPQPSPLLPVSMPLQVLYEDAHLIAINKPAGLVVHAGAGVRDATLVQGLLAHCQDLSGIGDALRPGIVHRLDRHTSGALVAAKHDRAHRALAAQFAQRRAKKTYLSVVWGCPTAAGTSDTLLGRHRKRRQCFTSRPELLARTPAPRRAVTHWRRLAHGGGLSLLRLHLETGRTHQIRVHLHDMGHPILGDALYEGPPLHRLPTPQLRHAASMLQQHALHAYRLEIVHPIDGRPLRLRAPLPMGMLELFPFLARG